jgi:hypothetical protein
MFLTDKFIVFFNEEYCPVTQESRKHYCSSLQGNPETTVRLAAAVASGLVLDF